MELRQYQIVLVNLNPTIGNEIKKTRPCVVISPNEMNRFLQTIVLAPMTSSSKTYPTRVEVNHDNKKGWIVGVNQPEKADDLLPEKLQLHNLSVATSGDVYQFIEHNGKKYSHIINPLTGYGVTSLRNVTVIANDGAVADWLATACSILPIKEAKKLALSLHAELLITERVNNQLKRNNTKGFDKYWGLPLIQEKQ